MSDFADKKAFIRENGVYLSSPEGSSMRPFIKGGRDIVVMTAPERPFKRYDVILYENTDGKTVIHRILRIDRNKRELFVRGDNSYYKEYVSYANVLAVAKYLQRGEKKVYDRGARLWAIRFWRLIYPCRYIVYVLRRRCAQNTNKSKK